MKARRKQVRQLTTGNRVTTDTLAKNIKTLSNIVNLCCPPLEKYIRTLDIDYKYMEYTLCQYNKHTDTITFNPCLSFYHDRVPTLLMNTLVARTGRIVECNRYLGIYTSADVVPTLDLEVEHDIELLLRAKGAAILCSKLDIPKHPMVNSYIAFVEAKLRPHKINTASLNSMVEYAVNNVLKHKEN